MVLLNRAVFLKRHFERAPDVELRSPGSVDLAPPPPASSLSRPQIDVDCKPPPAYQCLRSSTATLRGITHIRHDPPPPPPSPTNSSLGADLVLGRPRPRTEHDAAVRKPGTSPRFLLSSSIAVRPVARWGLHRQLRTQLPPKVPYPLPLPPLPYPTPAPPRARLHEIETLDQTEAPPPRPALPLPTALISPFEVFLPLNNSFSALCIGNRHTAQDTLPSTLDRPAGS